MLSGVRGLGSWTTSKLDGSNKKELDVNFFCKTSILDKKQRANKTYCLKRTSTNTKRIIIALHIKLLVFKSDERSEDSYIGLADFFLILRNRFEFTRSDVFMNALRCICTF